MEPKNEPYTAGDEMALRRFRAIADKIELEPALLEIPLRNIERWIAQGHWAVKHLGLWREKILRARVNEEEFQALLTILRSDLEEDLHWKGYSPFAGILTRDERDKMRCTYRH